MKWDYEIETLRDLAAERGRIDGDHVEALRAIAEQLERLANIVDSLAFLGLIGMEEYLAALEERDDPIAARFRAEVERLRASLT